MDCLGGRRVLTRILHLINSVSVNLSVNKMPVFLCLHSCQISHNKMEEVGSTSNCFMFVPPPRNVVRVKSPIRYFLVGNMRFGVYIVLISQEMRPGRVAKKAKNKEKKKLRDVTSHIFAQTTYIDIPHQSCHGE